ncbi:MAG TPA: ubiquinone/menaquinone biosynthesis methyltransferase [Acidobacteriaceae bacterium]|nr:ubiquinone/menaquinone biosynthesis methyltransferase [Acidobacteriaceae bacterium]
MNPLAAPPMPEHERVEGARPAAEGSESEAAAHVRELFSTIAPTYDRANHVLSFGMDRRWWRRTAVAFRGILARADARVLDICCGTGDLTGALLAERPANAEPATGLDFSREMLGLAELKYAGANVRWVEGDAMALPFPENCFDLVTSAFGFRNLSNYAAGLAEIHRVLRPGGSIGILECNQPDGLSGALYNLYFHRVLPIAGGWISGERAAYEWLPSSVQRFPRPPRMLNLMQDAGFTNCAWEGYFLRAAGLYRGTKV